MESAIVLVLKIELPLSPMKITVEITKFFIVVILLHKSKSLSFRHKKMLKKKATLDGQYSVFND